ncbi:hypothetical protein D3C80_1948130 [compost metagenome]
MIDPIGRSLDQRFTTLLSRNPRVQAVVVVEAIKAHQFDPTHVAGREIGVEGLGNGERRISGIAYREGHP